MSGLRVLEEDQAAVVEAIAERIFPHDDESPGAAELGVLAYIDGQLATAWGSGAGLYRAEPVLLPEDFGHGPQSTRTPVEVYRDGLRALAAYTEREHGCRFDGLTGEQKDAVLAALARGEIETFDDPLLTGSDFFALLRQNVIEGLFADPRHGGNRELGGWRWIGYPGDPDARGDSYADHIDRYDEPYAPEPTALAEPGADG